uniref:Uncharacterized protein n=1 Tax=Fagus sylvatica TaxID=28930 RepID=A0A2N9IAC8_FAGSY
MCPTNPKSSAPSASPPEGQWTTGLCGCFRDPCNCWVTFWCPCITFGRIAEIGDEGTHNSGAGIAVSIASAVIALFVKSTASSRTVGGTLLWVGTMLENEGGTTAPPIPEPGMTR